MSECQLRAAVCAFMHRQEDEACHFDVAETECAPRSYLQGLQAGVADALRTSADGLSELLDACTRCACSGGIEKPVEPPSPPQAGAKPSPGFAPSPTERARYLLALSDAHEARPVNRHARVFLGQGGQCLDRHALLCARNPWQQGAFSMCKRNPSPVDICRCTPNQCMGFQYAELQVDRTGYGVCAERAPTTTSHQYCSPEQTDSQLREHPEPVSGQGRQPMNINDEKAVKVNVGRGLAFEADSASPLNSAAPEGLRKPPLHNGADAPESGSLGEGGGSDCAAEQVIRDGSLWRALLQVLRRSEWWAQHKSPGEQTEAVRDLRAAVKQARAMADTLSDGDGVPLGGLWKAAQRCFAHGEGQFDLLTAEKLRRELDSTCQSLGEALQRVSELEQRLETDTDASMVETFRSELGQVSEALGALRGPEESVACGVRTLLEIVRVQEERLDVLEQRLRDSEAAREHLQGLECEARKRAVTIEAQRRTTADQLEQLADLNGAWVERLSALPLMGGNPELRFNELVATAEYIDAEAVRRGAYASGIRGRFDQLVGMLDKADARWRSLSTVTKHIHDECARLGIGGGDAVDRLGRLVGEFEELRGEPGSTLENLRKVRDEVLQELIESGHEPRNGFALAVRELARKHEASSELAERVGAQLESVVCALKRAGAEDLESVGAAVDRLAADRDAWKQDARSARRELLSIGRGPAPEAPPTEPAPPPAPSDLRDQYVCEGCRLILQGAGYYVSQVSEAFGEGEAQHCARCGDYLDSSLGAYVGFKVLRDPVELEHVHAAGVSSSKLERLIRKTSLQAAREVMQGAPADRIGELETAVANLKLEAEVAASEIDGMNRECKRLGEERDRYQELYRAANESAGHILRMGMPEPESEVFGAVLPLWRELCQLARLRHGEPLPEGSFELRLGSWLFTAAVGEVVKLERDGDGAWRVAPGTWLAEFRQPAEEDVMLWVSAFGLLNWQHTPMPQNSGLMSELRELVHDALTDSREPTPLPPEVKS